VVTKLEFRTKDEEASEGSIAGIDKSGEEIRGLMVDGVCLSLEYKLNCPIENREGDIDDRNAGGGDSFPLKNRVFRWCLYDRQGQDDPSR
jgi:hypothetical protein